MISMAKGFEMNDELSAYLLENPYIDVNVETVEPELMSKHHSWENGINFAILIYSIY